MRSLALLLLLCSPAAADPCLARSDAVAKHEAAAKATAANFSKALAVGHVLPAGTTWGGAITIEYVEEIVDVTHAGACPAPQPVP